MSASELAIALSAVFLILLVCSSFALEQTGLRNQRAVLAPVVSVLCIVGLMTSFPLSTGGRTVIEVVLVPYSALAYAILLTLILCLLAWVFSGWRSRLGRRAERGWREGRRPANRPRFPRGSEPDDAGVRNEDRVCNYWRRSDER